MPNTYAPERFQLEIPTLSPWLAEEQPGTKYLGPNINWANVPENILALLNLADPSGMMSMAPVGFISSPKGLSLGKKIKPIQEAVSKVKKLSPAQILRNKEIDEVIRSEVHKIIRAGNKGPSRTGGGLMDFLKEERGSWSNKPISPTRQAHIDAVKDMKKAGVKNPNATLKPAAPEDAKVVASELAKQDQTSTEPASLLQFLKDKLTGPEGERGSFSNKPLTRADIFREAPKPANQVTAIRERGLKEGWLVPGRKLGNKEADEFIKAVNTEKPSYLAKSAKEVLGNDLVAEIAEKGYSPQIRAKILARYATTPERQELVSQVAPRIEQLKEAAGPKSRGYIMGSFASTKPNPRDIDLIIAHPERGSQIENTANKIYVRDKSLHPFLMGNVGGYTSAATKKRIPSVTQLWRNEFKKRYPGADLIRLWSGLPVGAGLGDYLTEGEANDYDLTGYIQKYGVPDQSKGQHLTDEFKLPNHITFSTDSVYSTDKTPGGTWAQDADKRWHYKPSDYVLSAHPVEELKKYFKEYESDSILDLPKITK